MGQNLAAPKLEQKLLLLYNIPKNQSHRSTRLEDMNDFPLSDLETRLFDANLSLKLSWRVEIVILIIGVGNVQGQHYQQ